jgi:hypothetical protein
MTPCSLRQPSACLTAMWMAWAPGPRTSAEWYRDRGRKVAASGYLASVTQYLPELSGTEKK